MSKEYNGWKNYETWACHLWLTNDERAYDLISGIIGGIKTKFQDEADQKSVLSLHIREWVDNQADFCLNEEYSSSLMSDLLRGAISEIDFYEIAENLLGEKTTEEGGEKKE